MPFSSKELVAPPLLRRPCDVSIPKVLGRLAFFAGGTHVIALQQCAEEKNKTQGLNARTVTIPQLQPGLLVFRFSSGPCFTNFIPYFLGVEQFGGSGYGISSGQVSSACTPEPDGVRVTNRACAFCTYMTTQQRRVYARTHTHTHTHMATTESEAFRCVQAKLRRKKPAAGVNYADYGLQGSRRTFPPSNQRPTAQPRAYENKRWNRTPGINSQLSGSWV
jgi:hypothetical protein